MEPARARPLRQRAFPIREGRHRAELHGKGSPSATAWQRPRWWTHYAGCSCPALARGPSPFRESARSRLRQCFSRHGERCTTRSSNPDLTIVMTANRSAVVGRRRCRWEPSCIVMTDSLLSTSTALCRAVQTLVSPLRPLRRQARTVDCRPSVRSASLRLCKEWQPRIRSERASIRYRLFRPDRLAIVFVEVTVVSGTTPRAPRSPTPFDFDCCNARSSHAAATSWRRPSSPSRRDEDHPHDGWSQTRRPSVRLRTLHLDVGRQETPRTRDHVSGRFIPSPSQQSFDDALLLSPVRTNSSYTRLSRTLVVLDRPTDANMIRENVLTAPSAERRSGRCNPTWQTVTTRVAPQDHRF